VLLPFIVVVLDQLCKYGIVNFFEVPYNICKTNPNVFLHRDISPVVDFTLKCNQGISFGMLGGDSGIKRWALTVIAFAMVFVIFSILKDTKSTLGRLSLGLIIGGAIGNGMDRLLHGAVTDFIDITDLFAFFPYIFNIADSAITCGVVALLISLVLDRRAAQALKN